MLAVLKPATPTFVQQHCGRARQHRSDKCMVRHYCICCRGSGICDWHRAPYLRCLAPARLANTAGTATMTIASPCVVTWGSAAQADGAAVVFSTTGVLPTQGLTVGTTYYVKNRSGTTCNRPPLMAALTLIDTSGTQSVRTPVRPTARRRQRLTGTDPLWLDLGPTERWAMFDTFVSTGTSQTAGVTVTMTIASPVS